jgi:hypothetical protein
MHLFKKITYFYRCYEKIEEVNIKCDNSEMLNLYMQREYGVLQETSARPDSSKPCDHGQMDKPFIKFLTRLNLDAEVCILARLRSLPKLVLRSYNS